MKREQSNASTERILALLVLLLQGEHSRDEIFMSIADYRRGATAHAQQKMFERDLSTLERVGVNVSREQLRKGLVLYSVPYQQFRRDVDEHGNFAAAHYTSHTDQAPGDAHTSGV